MVFGANGKIDRWPNQRPAAVQTQTRFPSGSARTVKDGASDESTMDPPAETAAAIRSSATSGASHRSKCQRCRGVSWSTVPWNQMAGTRLVGSNIESETLFTELPVTSTDQKCPILSSCAVSSPTSSWVTADGSASSRSLSDLADPSLRQIDIRLCDEKTVLTGAQ